MVCVPTSRPMRRPPLGKWAAKSAAAVVIMRPSLAVRVERSRDTVRAHADDGHLDFARCERNQVFGAAVTGAEAGASGSAAGGTGDGLPSSVARRRSASARTFAPKKIGRAHV